MEKLVGIVNGTMAKTKISHICNSKACFQVETKEHLYQLEIDCQDGEWENTNTFPENKAIRLMRLIRKGVDNNNETFITFR